MFRKHRRVIYIISGFLLIFNIAILVANNSSRTSGVAEKLIEVDGVLPENEGKLVIVSGTPTLENDGVIVDEIAGLKIENAISYSRMAYQNVYVLKSEEVVIDKGKDKISDVDDKKEIRVYVDTDWIPANSQRERVINYPPKKYENPYPIDLIDYSDVNYFHLDAFLFEGKNISDYAQTESRGFSKEELEQNCTEYIKNTGFDLKPVKSYLAGGGEMLSSGDDVGDVCIELRYTTL